MTDLFLIPLLALHLLCMNVASAAPLVCCWLEWKGSGDALALRTAQYLGQASWRLLLLGAVLGAVYGASQWNADYQHLWLNTMWYKVKWGIAELAFSLVLMLAYASLPTDRWRKTRMTFAFLAGTNLLYHFPFLFSVATSLRAEGALEITVDAVIFRQWMLRPDVLARVVHVILASFAVTGVMLLGYALRLHKQGAGEQDVQRVSRWGGWLGLIPSLVQMVVGLWLITVLPPAWQQRLMSEDWVATLLLGASVLASLFLLQDLAALAMGEFQLPLLRRAMIVMVIIVVFMTGTLKRIQAPPENSATKILIPSLAKQE